MPYPELLSARVRLAGETRVRRARRAVQIWADAVSGGAFFNRWSTGLSFVLATFVGVPTLDNASLEGYAKAVVVAALGWVVLALLLVPAAIAERRIRARAVRGVTVVAALLLVTCIRTPLNDWLGVQLWGLSSAGHFGPRTVTNLISAIVLFSLVTVTHAQYAERRATSARLRNALATMQVRLSRAREQAALTQQTLADTAARLRAERDIMLAGPLDFDAVRSYADEVRSSSHALERLAAEVVEAISEPEVVDTAVRGRRSVSERLVATPWLIVAMVYVIGTLPFSLAAGGLPVVVLGMLGVAAIDLAAGAVVRWVIPDRQGLLRPILFVAVWTAAGVAVAALSLTLLPDIGVVGLVGVIAVPGLVSVLSLCIDAVHQARVVARRAETLLSDVARDLAGETSRAHDPLRRAVSLLHGRVQGRCVVLAAHVDEGDARERHLADFRRETDDAFGRMLGVEEREHPPATRAGELGDAGAGPIERILGAWGAVLEVTVKTSDRAALAMMDADVARQVVEVVNEALVNAVKHSGARAAVVDLDVADDGRMRVRAVSQGRLREQASGSSGLGTRGIDVTVTQSGDDVVFDALLPEASGHGVRRSRVPASVPASR